MGGHEAKIRRPPSTPLIYGLTAALYGESNIEGGRAVQSNFHDYQMLRMNEATTIEVSSRRVVMLRVESASQALH